MIENHEIAKIIPKMKQVLNFREKENIANIHSKPFFYPIRPNEPAEGAISNHTVKWQNFLL